MTKIKRYGALTITALALLAPATAAQASTAKERPYGRGMHAIKFAPSSAVRHLASVSKARPYKR
jgi:hypothetical protein